MMVLGGRGCLPGYQGDFACEHAAWVVELRGDLVGAAGCCGHGGLFRAVFLGLLWFCGWALGVLVFLSY